jgi:hypothetical protein
LPAHHHGRAAAFADEGLDLPMRAIARRAGLGIATVLSAQQR